MITLRPPNHKTWRQLVALEVDEGQDKFVAPNAMTLVQAPYEGGAHTFGIWNGEEAVGFVGLIDMRENRFLDEGDDPNAAYLWRFMIAKGHQGKGYGTAALDLFGAWAMGLCLPRLYTSAVIGNDVALGLYERNGFTRTGRVIDNEIELVRRL